MYKRLHASHFKSIETVDLHFGQVNLFVGNNASGKSNIIDLIRFVRDAVHNGLDRALSDRHGIESIRQWSPTRPYRVSVDIELQLDSTNYGKYGFSLDSRKGQYHIVREEAVMDSIDTSYFMDDDGRTTDEMEEATRTMFKRDQSGRIQQLAWHLPIEDMPTDFEEIIPILLKQERQEKTFRADIPDELWLSMRPSYYFGRLRQGLRGFQAYSIFPNTLRMPQEPSNEAYLVPEGRNLASVFKRMRRTKRGIEAISQITEGMRAILPNLERISTLSVGGFLVPQFHMIAESGRRHTFNVSQMSDGSLRVLGLLTALYQEPKPPAIALEEPEQTVNPGVLAVIAESIKEVSKTTQVFITTHSPHLLDQFDPEVVFAVELEEGKTRVGRISEIQIGVVRDRLFSLGELLATEGVHV